MKKLFMLISTLICLSACLTSCGFIWGRFNGIMRDYLGDIENYDEYECVLIETAHGEADENEHSDYTFIQVSLTEIPDEEPVGPECTLKVIPENADILKENGFFDEVNPDDTLMITTSIWIYGDANQFFCIQVKVGDKIYLDEETGLQNMIEYMKKHTSLL